MDVAVVMVGVDVAEVVRGVVADEVHVDDGDVVAEDVGVFAYI